MSTDLTTLPDITAEPMTPGDNALSAGRVWFVLTATFFAGVTLALAVTSIVGGACGGAP